MRDFYLFTSKKLTAEDCFEALSKEIKHIEMNGTDNIWINAKSRSFITFCNETLDDFFFESQEAKDELSNARTTYNALKAKDEADTNAANAVVTFGAALKYFPK